LSCRQANMIAENQSLPPTLSISWKVAGKPQYHQQPPCQISWACMLSSCLITDNWKQWWWNHVLQICVLWRKILHIPPGRVVDDLTRTLYSSYQESILLMERQPNCFLIGHIELWKQDFFLMLWKWLIKLFPRLFHYRKFPFGMPPLLP